VIIAAMVTPALLILASASLVATALVRFARVVDRARVLAAIALDGAWATVDATPAALGIRALCAGPLEVSAFARRTNSST
jgi:hypothetical protein